MGLVKELLMDAVEILSNWLSQVFTFQCSKKGCKKKEMLPVACDQCRGNFCIQHRHPLDHSCTHGSRAVSIRG